jgi:hypothetical protein
MTDVPVLDEAEMKRRAVAHREWLERAAIESAKCFTPTPSFNVDEDHWAFMALSFAFKQNEHARAVVALGRSVDANLIVRSMLEGLTQLVWAANAPEERALLWRAFSWVHDWRLLKAMDARGEAVEPDLRAAIADGIREHGDKFVTAKAKMKLADGEEVADPYRQTWSGKTARQLFEETGGAWYHEALYRPFSDWHHWNTPGLASRLATTDEGYTFTTRLSDREAAACLSAAFGCLMQTMEIADGAARLGRAEVLAELRAGYLKSFGRPTSSPAGSSSPRA